MKRTLVRNHNSLMVMIPKEYVDDMGLKTGDKLDFCIENKRIIAIPVHPSAKMNVQAVSAPVKETQTCQS